MVPVEAESCSGISIEPCSEACRSLLACLGEVVDSRKARGVRYPLGSVLGLCIVAFLCGRQNLCASIAFWARPSRFDEGTGVFGLAPAFGADVVSRAGAGFGQDLARGAVALAGFAGGLGAPAPALRRGGGGRQDLARLEGPRAQCVCRRHAAGPLAVRCGDEMNEIGALRELGALFERYPFLRILTGDALFAGNPLCSEIITHGRHYLFQIKDNQKDLREKMELVFARHLSREPQPSLTGEKKRLRRGA